MPSHPRPRGGENFPSPPPSTLTGTGFVPSPSPHGDFVPDGVPIPAKTSVTDQDGNGAPIPDSPQGILLLGDVNGAKLSPMGINLVEILSPSGMAGAGMVVVSPSPVPDPRPVAGMLSIIERTAASLLDGGRRRKERRMDSVGLSADRRLGVLS